MRYKKRWLIEKSPDGTDVYKVITREGNGTSQDGDCIKGGGFITFGYANYKQHFQRRIDRLIKNHKQELSSGSQVASCSQPAFYPSNRKVKIS